MRILRAILLFLRHTSWLPARAWTPADARALASFLASSTGRKLLRLLRGEIGAANERAAMKAAAFDCGWACGYRGLYAWFESLSAREPEEPLPAQAEHELDHPPASSPFPPFSPV